MDVGSGNAAIRGMMQHDGVWQAGGELLKNRGGVVGKDW